MTSEWKKGKIKDFGRIVTGKTPPTARTDFFEGPIPFLTPTDMLDGRKTVRTSRTLTTVGLESVKNCLVPKGVAVSCIGWQMGKTVLINTPTVTNQQINTIVVDESKFDLSFVYYLLASMREKIFELGATPTRTPIVNKTTFGEIPIFIPPFTEQRKIASIGAALDDRITLLRETNQTLESIAQAIFKSWFVDFDPVRAKMEGRQPEGMDEETAALFPDSFEESKLGLIPAGWQSKGLDEVATYLNGLALQKFPPTGEDDLPVIKIAQLRKGDSTGADLAAANIKPEYVVHDGDVLFSWSGSLEVEIWCGGKGALNQHLFKITSAQYPKWFFYLWTKHHLQSFREIAASKATTMGHIQRKHLSDAVAIVPCKKVFSDADKVFAPIIDLLIENALRIRNLSAIRDTLLPRLISGQLRLPEAQEQVEDALS
ncbi:restriction endonuclease subunit S [Alcaligenes faecalis]|uniref:restriction endonuclease subunit S n=1 Tax=Alcaligenes faecalis TaxID=511 RepID=UPI00137BCA25|nr:restriction endonuclease subunit S [Alcaligenes faecalis]QHS36943.1 restriction endonuclease subunit S [Alcaligenes faecalis]